MFSGIVQQLGSVKSLQRVGSVVVVAVACNLPSAVGSSVLVNGICSTVARKKKNLLQFEYVKETQGKTTVNQWNIGTRVNLEPSLRLGDELSGHVVMGHIDGVGTVTVVKKNKHDVVITVRVKKPLPKFIAPKGSVCIDGVSLTIVETNRDSL